MNWRKNAKCTELMAFLKQFSCMTTVFSDLDLSNQKLIAQFVSQTFLTDLNRKVSIEEIIRLFNAYKVEVDWTGEEMFSIRKDEKLEQAVRQISANF